MSKDSNFEKNILTQVSKCWVSHVSNLHVFKCDFHKMNIQNGEIHKTINFVVSWVSSSFYFLNASIAITSLLLFTQLL